MGFDTGSGGETMGSALLPSTLPWAERDGSVLVLPETASPAFPPASAPGPILERGVTAGGGIS